MGLVTVNFECVDQEIVPNPVTNAVVRVYETDDTFVTELISDAVTGIASGLLDGQAAPTPHAYNIRLYKFGSPAVDNPQRVEVYDPPGGAPVTGTNDFKIRFDPHAAVAPADPRLCRLSGHFRRVDGNPASGLGTLSNNTAPVSGPTRGHVLRITSLMDPLIVDGNGAFSSPVYCYADDDGLVEVDLFREGTYSVIVEDIHPGCIQEAHRIIHVPDRSTANLLDVLFPVVLDVSWNPAGPWSVAVGGELDVVPTLTASDYRVLEGIATYDVEYTVDDTSIATVTTKDDSTLTVVGVASGSTTLRVTRRDESVVRVPGDISGGAVVITVT
jgi:hypothetical protein